MNKELEVLIKNSKNIVDKYEEWAIGEIKKFADKNEWSLKLMSGFIEKALTPPTSEEVCKALSEYYGQDVVYTNLKAFMFINHNNNNNNIYPYLGSAVWKNGDNIRFDYDLPPDLVTLVGKFYKGVKEND